jgi:hypothetical protein
MPTSGTAEFNLDLNNLIEEAFERCGAELRTGYNWRTARRSLNLMSIEWANRGLNLWTIEQGSFPLTTGQAIYPIPTDTIDMLDHVIRTQPTTLEQIDINISRIAEPTYSSIPNKLAQGRPIQLWFNRQTGAEYTTSVTLAQNIDAVVTTIPLSTTVGLPSAGFIKLDNETISYPNISGNSLVNCARGQNNTTAASHTITPTPPIVTVQNLPCINVWPTPNAPGDQYTFVYWRMRRIQDGGLNGTVIQDIPFRLLPCMVAGLAFYLSMKLPEVDPSRIAMLKAAYEEQWDLAAAEDRDTAPLRIVPRNMFYYG